MTPCSVIFRGCRSACNAQWLWQLRGDSGVVNAAQSKRVWRWCALFRCLNLACIGCTRATAPPSTTPAQSGGGTPFLPLAKPKKRKKKKKEKKKRSTASQNPPKASSPQLPSPSLLQPLSLVQLGPVNNSNSVVSRLCLSLKRSPVRFSPFDSFQSSHSTTPNHPSIHTSQLCAPRTISANTEKHARVSEPRPKICQRFGPPSSTPVMSPNAPVDPGGLFLDEASRLLAVDSMGSARRGCIPV